MAENSVNDDQLSRLLDLRCAVGVLLALESGNGRTMDVERLRKLHAAYVASCEPPTPARG